jgi:hypothetical protein
LAYFAYTVISIKYSPLVSLFFIRVTILKMLINVLLHLPVCIFPGEKIQCFFDFNKKIKETKKHFKMVK